MPSVRGPVRILIGRIGYRGANVQVTGSSRPTGKGDCVSVFVFDRESSTVSKRPIRAGGVRDNDVAVLEGLAEGDIIATAGVPFLREGQVVTLLGSELVRNAP